MSGKGGGKSAEKIREGFRDRANEQRMTTRCGIAGCRFKLTASTLECLWAAHYHLIEEHGFKESTKTKRRPVGTYRQHLTEDRLDEIEAEVARRRRLHGIEEAA